MRVNWIEAARVIGVLALMVASAATAGAQTINEIKPQTVFQLTPVNEGDEPPVVTSLELQPGGKLLALAGDDHVVRLWDVTSTREVRLLREHTDWVRTVAFSPDGQTLATAGNDRRLLLWDPEAGQLRRVLATQDSAITAIRFSPDGTQLAACGFNDTVLLYDLETGAVTQRLGCGCDDMRAIAFSPDGAQLAAAGRDGRVMWWNTGTGEIVHEAQPHRQRVRGVAFSHDGAQVISAGEDRQLSVMNARDGKLEFTLSTRPAKTLALNAFANGQVATSGSDNQIRLWELATRTQTARLVGHTGSVSALAYDRGLLVSGSYDTTVRLWKIDGDRIGAKIEIPGLKSQE